MKIYTKKGDTGETSLIGGTRVSKAHLRIDAYGTVDELNAHIGLVQAGLPKKDEQYAVLTLIQNDLFVMGSLLAEDTGKSRMQLPQLDPADVVRMENAIDGMNESLPELKTFILPSGHAKVARAHIARCVCRRAERSVVRLAADVTVQPIILEYLNRLSDYLFVLGRRIGSLEGVEEVPWKPRS